MTPSWFVTGQGTYASSPMRVTLAERKVCSTKTMGLGQECRSSAWGEMESGVSCPTSHCRHWGLQGWGFQPNPASLGSWDAAEMAKSRRKQGDPQTRG